MAMVIRFVKNMQSSVNGIWIGALCTVNSEVPTHAAAVTVSESQRALISYSKKSFFLAFCKPAVH